MLLLVSLLVTSSLYAGEDALRKASIEKKKAAAGSQNRSLLPNVNHVPTDFSVVYGPASQLYATYISLTDSPVDTASTVYFYSEATGQKIAFRNSDTTVSYGSAVPKAQSDNQFYASSIGRSDDGNTIFIAFSAYSRTDLTADSIYRSKAWYVRSTNQGASWSAPVPIDTTRNFDCKFVSVAPINENGFLNVVYGKRANQAGSNINGPTIAVSVDTMLQVYKKINASTGVATVTANTGVKSLTYDAMSNGGGLRLIQVDPTSNGQKIYTTQVTSFIAGASDRNAGYGVSTNGGTTWTSSNQIASARVGFPYLLGLVDVGAGLGPVIGSHFGTGGVLSFSDGPGTTTFTEFPAPQSNGEAVIWVKGAVNTDKRINFFAANSGASNLTSVGVFNADPAALTYSAFVQIPTDTADFRGAYDVATAPNGKVAYAIYGRTGTFIKIKEAASSTASFEGAAVKLWVVPDSLSNGLKVLVGSMVAVPKEISPNAKTFALGQNYPNPFNPTTNIDYALKTASNVTLKVYDVLGREVETLFSGRQITGTYRYSFDASRLSSGVYFYRLQAGEFVETKKMMLVK